MFSQQPAGFAPQYQPQPGFVPAAAGTQPMTAPTPAPQPPAPAAPPAVETASPPDPGAQCLRWTWGAYPNTARPTNADAQPGMFPLPPAIVPLACMYTPLHQPQAESGPIPTIRARPAVCKNCGALMSNKSHVDLRGHYWTCRSCLARNQLAPEMLAEGSALHLAAQTHSSTVEYATGENVNGVGPCFIFVVDTCILAEELEALKSSLLRSLELLPPAAMVGFISFGRSVTLWELGCSDLNKCYALRGTRKYSTDDLGRMLNVTPHAPVVGRFLAPREDVEFALSSIMEELMVDPFPVPTGTRAQRATGTAVDVAVSLLGFVGSKKFGKVVLFTGGPCTRGPGTIVGIDKAEMIRFHRDFLDGNVPHYKAACEFYAKIEAQLLDCNACLDVFAQSLDQVGVMELKGCVNNTGGVMVCGDTFDHLMFTESLLRYFGRADLRASSSDANPAAISCGFGAEISVFASSDTLISGAVGPCRAAPAHTGASSAPSSSPPTARQVSPVQIGVGGVSTWRVSCLDQHSTIAFVFDTCNKSPASPTVGGAERFIQFVTRYIAPDGEVRIRVTSIVQPVVPSADPSQMAAMGQFDQACAAAVFSRLTVALMEAHETKWETTKRWLDRMLVKFVKLFGSYRRGEPDSLRLQPVFSLFPIFIYNLRRSEYFMILNISPDETTFKRHWLMRETCDSCLLMIQPTLDSYTLAVPEPTPVPLDASSITPDNILLMDAFYNIHIVQGATIHEWEKHGYHNLPDYAHFNFLLQQPQLHAQAKLAERFPYPRFSRTHVDGSESRHVKTRLNPSITHNTGQLQGGQKAASEVIYTDDASIARFMHTLKVAVVNADA